MAYRRKTRKTRRPRRFRRRFRKRRGQGNVNSYQLKLNRISPNLLQPRFIKKLRYCDSSTLTDGASSGLIIGHGFRANSLFDPDFSGGGHQPMGFDEVMNLYNHYHVIASKITVNWRSLSAGSPDLVVGILRTPDTVTLGGMSLSRVQEFGPRICRWKPLMGTGAGNAMTWQSATFSAKKEFGGSILANDQLKGTASANAAEQTYYYIYAVSPTATNFNISYSVTIDYVAVFSEPRLLSQS